MSRFSLVSSGSYRTNASFRPVVALVAGINGAPGRIMGHAGAFIIPGEPDAKAKIAALEAAGATVVDHPAKMGDALRARLGPRATVPAPASKNGGLGGYVSGGCQRRQYHTTTVTTRRPRCRMQGSLSLNRQQRRHLYLPENKCMDLLRETGKVNCGANSGSGPRKLFAIGIDRSARSPCILASPDAEDSGQGCAIRRYTFEHVGDLDRLVISRIASHLQLSQKDSVVESLRRLAKSLAGIFFEKEAFYMSTSIVERLGEVEVVGARFGFDDAAYRSSGRQADLQKHRDVAAEDRYEIEAEKHGIVYIKLQGDGAVGTLVNGAGLAMNTVDALSGHAANFLDTGGKATSETVKKCFEIILRDQRVRVIFVNIFGGLTRGDMIATGIIMAFKELSPNVPVVVRIRGTNEEEGQRLIAESGLPLYAFDDFEKAAAKAIELSTSTLVQRE